MADRGGHRCGADGDATRSQSRSDTDLVIVTGVSGGGRSTVARALENVGYYVVDNLPQALMLDMAELAYQAGGTARHTAMVLDVRSRAFSTDLAGAVQALRDRGFTPAGGVRRRRRRGADPPVRERPAVAPAAGRAAGSPTGIAAERELLAEAREAADVLIDTSHLNVNQLRARIEELFGGEDARRLRVTVLSFGFKYGLPPDADFVLDARFLPNPYWVPELRDHTGRDETVSRYVLGQRGAATFVETYARLINATAPGFEREGKRYLTVAVGCTGGKHRSVAIAEELARRLRERARHGRQRPTPRPGAGVTDRLDGGRHGSWRSVAGTGCPRRCARCGAPGTVALEITAIVTVGDDGGSSGRLRAERGGLPPGDLRQALAALAGPEDPIARTGRPSCSSTGSRRRRSAGRSPGRESGAVRADGADRRPGRRARPRGRAWCARSVGCCRCRARRCSIEAEVRGADPGQPDQVTTVRGQHEVAVTRGSRRGAPSSPGRPAGLSPRRSGDRGAPTGCIFGPGSWYTSVIPHLLVPESGRADHRRQRGPSSGYPEPRGRAGDGRACRYRTICGR